MKRNNKINSQKRYTQESRNTARGGKLVPVMAVGLYPNEKTVLSQQIVVELEKIAGRLTTDVFCNVSVVVVPNLASDALFNADNDHPGNSEIFRQRLIDGEMIFPLEAPSVITDRMGITPRRVNGEPVVNSVARIAHNAAVNHLRISKYVDANTVGVENDEITPALVSTTALDRFNAVLDPEDRVNGSVTLAGEIPIRGIGLAPGWPTSSEVTSARDSDKEGSQNLTGWRNNNEPGNPAPGRANFFIEEDADRPGFPNIRADFGLTQGQSLSLADFYMAQKMDGFTRMFRDLIDQYPEHGYEQIIRMVHGMSVETGRIPYTVYNKTVPLRNGVKGGMDGPSLDIYQTNVAGMIDYTVPVDGSEFGATVITFIEVKPEEVIAAQPHPFFSHPIRVDNVVAQELAIHPVPVHMRDLDTDVAPENEMDVAFWCGPEHFRSQYTQFGYNRGVDPETVNHKTSVWRYELPLSVSPETVIYPEYLDHYPFGLNGPDDAAFSYVCISDANVASPTVLGPDPVENIPLLDTVDVFEDE